MVTYQLQVLCRPVKVRRSETDVLPLSHTTKAQTQELEAIQKRANHIIFQFSWGMSYSNTLLASNLTSLSSQRRPVCLAFFSSALPILHPVSTIFSPAMTYFSYIQAQIMWILPKTLHLHICYRTVHSCNMAFPTTILGFRIDIIIITLNCFHVLVLSILLIVLHCGMVA